MFQAAFASSVARPKERIFFTKMDHVLKLLPKEFQGKSHFKDPFLYKIFDRLVVPFLINPLVHIFRLVTLIREVPGTDQVEVQKGIFRKIVWIEGYFQGQNFFDPEKVRQWTVNEQFQRRASKALRDLVPPGRVSVALHWRLGDYKNFTVFGEKNPSLPVGYFQEAIQRIQKSIKNPFFIFFSDEPEQVATQLNLNSADYAVSYQPPEIDVLTMSLCDHLILSNSTLAWWGGYWGKGAGKLIFAPRNWLGWKNGVTYPPAIEPGFATLIEPHNIRGHR
ncbi:MAG: alpha-1,2-fucosyltransferase [Spirochaetales bacterium]|nr:alpha-1,2-fucosyltransferase [Spirochaetales bacterium]